ncbi:EF-hand domain-containing protein [Phenylobacterium sp.]|uniref:EF-hand domain-containing protein n=1 Tax=Phenylobacterium sp. TaxID=1871053 RepID=UPI0035AEA7DF
MSMEISGAAAAGQMHAMSGASRGAPPRQKMSNLFDAIDTAGTGTIGKSQFEQAFQTKNPPSVFKAQGADAIFSALDPQGTGSVSKADFISTMTQLMVSLRSGDAAQGTASSTSPSQTLADSLNGLNQLDATTVDPNAPAGGVLDINT